MRFDIVRHAYTSTIMFFNNATLVYYTRARAVEKRTSRGPAGRENAFAIFFFFQIFFFPSSSFRTLAPNKSDGGTLIFARDKLWIIAFRPYPSYDTITRACILAERAVSGYKSRFCDFFFCLIQLYTSKRLTVYLFYDIFVCYHAYVKQTEGNTPGIHVIRLSGGNIT